MRGKFQFVVRHCKELERSEDDDVLLPVCGTLVHFFVSPLVEILRKTSNNEGGNRVFRVKKSSGILDVLRAQYCGCEVVRGVNLCL